MLSMIFYNKRKEFIYSDRKGNAYRRTKGGTEMQEREREHWKCLWHLSNGANIRMFQACLPLH
jgi:hypothetical protein